MKEYIEDPTFDPENPEDVEAYAARDAKCWEQVASSFAEMAMRCEHEAFRLSGIIERMKQKLHESDIEKRLSGWGNEVREDARIEELQGIILERDAEIAELRKATQPEWTTETPTEPGWYWVIVKEGATARWMAEVLHGREGTTAQDMYQVAVPIDDYISRFKVKKWCRITPLKAEQD